MAKGIRKSGEFCWINILTPKPDDARRFFTEMFGWTYADMPDMGGGIIHVGDDPVGGIWDLENPNTPPGTPPGIGVMFKVDSADVAAERIRAIGGTAQEPMDIMTNGRMVAATDPTRASFDLWEAKSSPGSTGDSSQHGVPSWAELLTSDTKRAAEFYGKLFGWTPNEMDMGRIVYTTFKLGDDYAGGMMQLTADMGQMQPGWYAYVTVSDIDKAVETATRLGAHVFMPSMEVPGTGTMAGIISPQGVLFYVIRYSA